MRLVKIKGVSVLLNHLNWYPTSYVGYISSFGSLAGVCLFLQIITGLVLSIHYIPHIEHAFISVEHIIRDVNEGWIFRYYHSNGASIFFFCLYAHIYVNIYSEADDLVWLSGVALYILAIIIAFLGYTLPWGQISYWGATVITNILASIPIIGTSIAQWLWGGFSISNPTLNRFFVLHFCLPFVIVAVVIIHLALLHIDESSSANEEEQLAFYYYYLIKDIFAFSILILAYIILVFFRPNILSHPDNYIPATITYTPKHLVPEWYFLPFYAILRSVPNKFGGLLLILYWFADFFLLDLFTNDDGNEDFIVDSNSPVEQYKRETGTDTEFDIGTIIIFFYIGGADVKEPFTDIVAILLIIHMLEYTEVDIELMDAFYEFVEWCEKKKQQSNSVFLFYFFILYFLFLILCGIYCLEYFNF